jgi:hypothetical protein
VTLRRLGAGQRDREGLLLGRQLRGCARALPLDECRRQPVLHEAPPRPLDRGDADLQAHGDLGVGTALGRQQQGPGPPDLPRRGGALGHQRPQLPALAIRQVDHVSLHHDAPVRRCTMMPDHQPSTPPWPRYKLGSTTE